MAYSVIKRSIYCVCNSSFTLVTNSKSAANRLLNILIHKGKFVPLYTRSYLFALVVCLGVTTHPKCMAQVRTSSPFNTVGDVYNKPRNNDIRDGETDAFDEEADVEDIANPPLDSIKTYMPTVALPLRCINVNSPFGVRKDPMNKRSKRMHSGLDLKAKFEEVYSMLPGVVITASYSTNGGYYVTVNHGACVCSYLHLSKILVRKGQHIAAGDIIAISGNSGKRTTGPHLHISCRWGNEKGKFFNPMLILRFVAEQLLRKE